MPQTSSAGLRRLRNTSHNSRRGMSGGAVARRQAAKHHPGDGHRQIDTPATATAMAPAKAMHGPLEG